MRGVFVVTRICARPFAGHTRRPTRAGVIIICDVRATFLQARASPLDHSLIAACFSMQAKPQLDFSSLLLPARGTSAGDHVSQFRSSETSSDCCSPSTITWAGQEVSSLTSREPFFIPAERWTRVSDPHESGLSCSSFIRESRQLPRPPI